MYDNSAHVGAVISNQIIYVYLVNYLWYPQLLRKMSLG